MKLPFTLQQFLDIFRNYNEAVYPLQILFVLLAAWIIVIAYLGNSRHQKFILFTLAAFWLWMGAVYHLLYFSVINKAAYVFGGMFILQGILLLIHGLTKPSLFTFGKNFHTVVSASLLIYALILYPLIGHFAGHGYPYSPTFGLPCPTTIFTIAIFLISRPRLPFYLAVIPLLWSVIGFSAAFNLAIYEDAVLIIAGLSFAILLFTKTTFGWSKNQFL
jgi:hypothetical protein